jgi:hypothetical protein
MTAISKEVGTLENRTQRISMHMCVCNIFIGQKDVSSTPIIGIHDWDKSNHD